MKDMAFLRFGKYISHILSDLHHVKVLQRLTVFDTKLEVAIFVSYWVSIKSQLTQLVSLFDRLNRLKLINPIV